MNNPVSLLLLTFLFVSPLFFSCRHSGVEPEIKAFLNSQISLPENLRHEIDSISADHDYSLIYIVEAEECVPCSLLVLNTISHFKSEFDTYNTGIIITINGKADKDSTAMLLNEMRINYPVVFDTHSELFSLNKVIKNHHICRTFIIDKNYNVIWIGSPVKNSESLERYRKTMEIRQNL